MPKVNNKTISLFLRLKAIIFSSIFSAFYYANIHLKPRIYLKNYLRSSFCKLKITEVPISFWLEIRISTASNTHNFLTIDKPRPVPFISGWSVESDLKKELKTFSTSFESITIPESTILHSTVIILFDIVIVNLEFLFEYFTALEIKLFIIMENK